MGIFLSVSASPKDPDLVCRRLASVSLAVFASPDLAASLPVGPDPAALPWVQWSAELAHLPLARFVAGHLGKRAPVVTSNSFLVLLEAVRAGQGCMVMPRFQGLRSGLVPLSVPVEPMAAAPVFLVYPASLRPLPRVRVVVECVEDLVGALDMVS